MGDVNGIGPEITLRALTDSAVLSSCCPILLGSAFIAGKAAALIGSDVKINVINHPQDAVSSTGAVNIIEAGAYDEDSLRAGEVQALAGRMAADFIEKSIELGINGSVSAVATAPINKQAIKLAGISEPGHTEIYETGSGSGRALTMFQCGRLRVFFLSRHTSLRNAIDLVTKENITNFLVDADFELRRLGIGNPFFAVAALNPHGSDDGLFGNEELREIIPAVAGMTARGIKCEGPVSADSVFHLAKEGRYDAVLSLYHDQGHIACKTLDFERTVALTLGLPFLRTSVDHGTAFDIAWKGVASAVSMTEAILVAAQYS